VLYFILDALHKINPMYQYSLDYYIAVFENSIKKSNAAEQLHERITNLNDYHTYAVYENVCRGLFERHKLPFAFQICMKILISENVVDTDEFEFLLDGGVGPKSEKPVATPCPGISSVRLSTAYVENNIYFFFLFFLPRKIGYRPRAGITYWRWVTCLVFVK